MALDGKTLIDPYGGLTDIRTKTLRHVSEAFKEDPVRILRIARFKAKLPEFSIATETQQLLNEMVANGEADSLIAERVFLEMRKTLKEKSPSQFVTVLRSCGLWKRFFFDLPISQNILDRLDQNTDIPESEKFVLLTHCEDNPAQIKAFITRLKPPAEIIDLINLWNKLKGCFVKTDSESVLKLIEMCDAVRRPERLNHVLHLAQIVYDLKIDVWQNAFDRIKHIDYAQIAASCLDKSKIGEAIHQARLLAIEECN